MWVASWSSDCDLVTVLGESGVFLSDDKSLIMKKTILSRARFTKKTLICLNVSKKYTLVVVILNEFTNYMSIKNNILFILKIFLNNNNYLYGKNGPTNKKILEKINSLL